MYERNVSWVEKLVDEQNRWRMKTINLIASEKCVKPARTGCHGFRFCSSLCRRAPGEWYYQGTDKIDEIEARVK